jgi:hypothetical protein
MSTHNSTLNRWINVLDTTIEKLSANVKNIDGLDIMVTNLDDKFKFKFDN